MSSFICVGLSVALIFGVSPVAAKETKFEPQKISIELSGYEPVPNGVSSEVQWGGWGGGPDVYDWDHIEWTVTPLKFVYPARDTATFEACGYPPNEGPEATLTLPSGDYYTSDSNSDLFYERCWDYTLAGKYGMELGTYKLVLDHPMKQLSYSWEVGYPNSPVEDEFTYMFNDDPREIALMGFDAFQDVTIHFYSHDRYAATRTVQADANGAAYLILETSRSAPFDVNSVFLLFEDYNKLMEVTGTLYSLVPRIQCDNGLRSRLVKGGNGYVLPGDSNRVRGEPEGTIIGKISPDTEFLVKDGPLCGGSNGLMWWKISTYGGLTGWTVESDNSEYWLAPSF